MFHEIMRALEETIFMVFAAGLFTWLIGLPLGMLLATTAKGKLLENKIIHRPLQVFLTTTRSVPYVALMISVIPLTQWITGSKEGCFAAILPLTLAAIPYFTDLSERAIHRVPLGLIEAAESMGASRWQIIYKVLFPEALPNIIKGLTQTITHLIGYSTIAGALGCGGLGSLLIQQGYHVFQIEYVLTTLILMVALTHLIQRCGHYIADGNTG
jgi:D-methionine transport system permease protein